MYTLYNFKCTLYLLHMNPFKQKSTMIVSILQHVEILFYLLTCHKKYMGFILETEVYFSYSFLLLLLNTLSLYLFRQLDACLTLESILIVL